MMIDQLSIFYNTWMRTKEDMSNEWHGPTPVTQKSKLRLVWMFNEITKGQLIAMQVGRNKDNESLKHSGFFNKEK